MHAHPHRERKNRTSEYTALIVTRETETPNSRDADPKTYRRHDAALEVGHVRRELLLDLMEGASDKGRGRRVLQRNGVGGMGRAMVRKRKTDAKNQSGTTNK
jgi:hypothetical protein